MSFNTKRTIRKLSRSKSKHVECDTYTIQHLPVLRRKRTVALNRLLKALEVGNKARSDDLELNLFLSYCDELDKWTGDFEHAHFSILELLESSGRQDTDGADSDLDDDDIRSRFDDTYFRVMAIRRLFLKPNLNTSDVSHQSDNNPSALSRIRLPKIQLPTFSGDIKLWPEFIDSFNALIHDCPQLKNVEKFHYLVSSLTDDPLLLVRTFPVTEVHYPDAYASLVSRYQNKRELAFTCWRDILNINFKFQNANEFRKTLDTIDENLSILKKLNLPVEHWDFILGYHILSKLDSKLRREFEEKGGHDEYPTYVQIKQFLHLKCEALLRDNHFSVGSQVGSSSKEVPKRSANTLSKRSSALHTLVSDNSGTNNNNSNKQNKVENKSNNFNSNQNPNRSLKCSFCSGEHSISQCKLFLSKSVDERMSIALANRWCFNCLKSSHQIKDCISIFRCLKCKHKHHSLLHQDRIPVNNNSVRTDSQSVASVVKDLTNTSLVSKSSSSSTVLLATAMVQVRDADGQHHSFRALFDTGSQNNFITKNAAQCLNLKSIPCVTNINGLGGIAAHTIGLVNCSIASQSKPLFNVDLHVISNICGDQPIAKLNTVGWSHIQSLPLADPGFDVPGPIDILLGADVFADALLTQRVKGTINQPVAFNSVFGWLLLGRTSLVTSSLLQFSSKPDSELCSLVQRFWEIDSIPQASTLTPDEITCEQRYTSEYTRDASGRYIVRLPFKDSAEPIFEGSRDIALRRFHAIERRMSRDPDLHQQYSEFMDDYIQSGHMTLVDAKKINQGKYYIPHHCVLKPDSTTTKLRVVFDASAKDTQGQSLNDTLLTGPKLQNNIVAVLLHFRLHAVVFMADIRQMYRQIRIADDQRDYQRILWRTGSNQCLQEFQLNTVTYGVSSAPYLACRTIQQLAEDEGSSFPLARQILKSNIYVDDVVAGFPNLETALEAKSQIVQLFDRGHFQLRKWATNKPRLLSDLPSEECLLDLKSFSDDQPTNIKVLGLQWDPVSDSFQFHVKPLNRSCTKRNILSEIARVFDPLGFLSPLTIKIKILLQRLWLLGTSWDADAPEDIACVWNSFCNQLSMVQELRVPRCLAAQNVEAYELHGFCDSSELAYGAILYMRIIFNDGTIKVLPLCAKTRVAPIKKLSLPRLELCAAVVLASLVKFIRHTYNEQLHFDATYLWSDSTVVLSWLRSHSSRWATFVANRVSAIQEIVPADSWHHVASGDNPADVCSRGLLPQELLRNTLWWSGPAWLSRPLDRWPKQSQFPILDEAKESIVCSEERKSVALIVKHASSNQFTPLDYLLNRYSSLDKIIRIVSYVRRFLPNSFKNNKSVIPHETENYKSLMSIVKYVQSIVFVNEIQRLTAQEPLSKPFRKLNPFLDEEGVLRVGGRISRAGIEYEQKHPALLPCDHPFTSKLIESIHRQHCHTGHNTTHYLITQRFWILSAKRAIRTCLSKCIRCYKTNPKTLQPYMADLPSYRVNQVKPFSVVGVDFGGPFRIKIGPHRGARIDKAYLCLFICLATKAVHLEVASSLSTEAFVAALRRFVGRRGRCSVIRSDCGTNFVGARNYLASLEQASQTLNIKFDVNPPSGPHFGGVWEIQINAAKSHLFRIVGNQVLTFEELSTLFVQIEAVLNSRPLCPLSADANDLNVLTPGHFLTLEPLTSVPDEDYSNVKLYRLSRWQLIQSFLQNFWVRWRNEYLHSLMQRAKWTTISKPLPVNSLVIIKDDIRTPLRWSLGRVTELHPGIDGIVRVATVFTNNNFIKRPLVKLCPLPIEPTTQ